MKQKCGCLADRVKRCLRRRLHGQHIQPLSALYSGGKITIRKIKGDRQLCARVAAMGLYPGCEAELVCPQNGSQCIVRIHGSRICLDHTISDNVMVTSI